MIEFFRRKNNYNFIELRLVGYKHYRRFRDYEFEEGEDVHLLPEPENKFDSNAIKVLNSEFIKIGYIKREQTTEIHNYIDKRFIFEAFITAILNYEDTYSAVCIQATPKKSRNPKRHFDILQKKNIGAKLDFDLSIKNALYFYKTGLNFEIKNDIINAIDNYEKSILYIFPPPLAYIKLAKLYKQQKTIEKQYDLLKFALSELNNRHEEHQINPKYLQTIKRLMLAVKHRKYIQILKKYQQQNDFDNILLMAETVFKNLHVYLKYDGVNDTKTVRKKIIKNMKIALRKMLVILFINIDLKKGREKLERFATKYHLFIDMELIEKAHAEVENYQKDSDSQNEINAILQKFLINTNNNLSDYELN